MIMISSFLFNFIKFCFTDIFFTKLLTLGILFSKAVRAVVVAKIVILGNSFLNPFMLALREALAVKL